jgi:prevent-host-death family protein
MKDTYSVKDLQRDTSAAIRAAESGRLVTITRRDTPVVHIISTARLGALLETMELLADPGFRAQVKKLRSGKLKLYPASRLAD